MDGPASTTRMLASLQRSAFTRVDGASLAGFRIVFGLGVAAYCVKALFGGEVRGIFVDPPFHFSYWGLSWIKPWPGVGMYFHFVVMALCSGMMACGVAYRVTSVLTALLFSFVFFCDRTAYLNHYYLMVLLAWMMVFLPADRVASLHRTSEADSDQSIFAWQVWFVRFHVALPYFFGGVAKLNWDWLQGQPMRMTLSQQPWFDRVSELIGAETIVALFVVGGLVFDLAIVPALCWSKTRRFAFVLATGFHLTNAYVFPIGVFPWLMIGATTIFFSPAWPRQFRRQLLRQQLPTSPTALRSTSIGAPRWLCVVMVYCLLHCLIPLRFVVLNDHPSWTERTHFFSWHMMLRGKRAGLRMYVTDRAAGETWAADLRKYITAYQYPKVSRDPEHLRQLAHIIAKHETSLSGGKLEVRAFDLVSLNGRKPQLLVDPTVNLAEERIFWRRPEWIRELSHPLRRDHWEEPLLNWELALQLSGDSIIREATGTKVRDSPPQARSRLSGRDVSRSSEVLVRRMSL